MEGNVEQQTGLKENKPSMSGKQSQGAAMLPAASCDANVTDWSKSRTSGCFHVCASLRALPSAGG